MSQPNDRQRKTLAVVALAELLRHELSEAGVKMFIESIEDIPADRIEQAAMQWTQRSKFFPAPAELRELAGDGTTTYTDRALMAWQAFDKAVCEVGYYRSPDFDDPLINATVRNLGGWMRMCKLEGDEFDKWLRKDFLSVYASLCRVGVGEEQTAPLVGAHQRENRRLGYTKDDHAVTVATGLPWAGELPKRLPTGKRPVDIPRLELKRAQAREAS